MYLKSLSVWKLIFLPYEINVRSKSIVYPVAFYDEIDKMLKLYVSAPILIQWEGDETNGPSVLSRETQVQKWRFFQAAHSFDLSNEKVPRVAFLIEIEEVKWPRHVLVVK